MEEKNIEKEKGEKEKEMETEEKEINLLVSGPILPLPPGKKCELSPSVQS